MEIITPRMAQVPLGFKKFGSKQGYQGEKEILPQELTPIYESFHYSSLYLLDRENLLSKNFDWMYLVNEKWIEENKKDIFNYSYNNTKEFDAFIERMQFPVLEDKLLNNKEKNHLITKLSIPIESIDKIFVYRYPGHCRALSQLRHMLPPEKEIRHYEERGGYQANRVAKLHEFIIR
jgi:hypothetical protein